MLLLTRAMLPFLAIGVLIAIALFAAFHGQADEAPPPPRPAVEYRVYHLAFDDYEKTEEWKQVLAASKDTFRAVFAFHELALENLGRDGWELVHVDGKAPSAVTFYLKRLKE